MNRFKKEELKADGEPIHHHDFDKKLLHQHIKDFPEEYDFILDSHADANERAMGINPMSKDYQRKVNEKRKTLGVKQLLPNGMAPVDSGSLEITARNLK